MTRENQRPKNQRYELLLKLEICPLCHLVYLDLPLIPKYILL